MGILLVAILSVTTDPSKMQYADHEFACRFVPVLGVLVVTTFAAYCRRSRTVFWASLAAVPMSLLIPEPDRGHVLIRGMEGAWVYALNAAFFHSAFYSLVFGLAAVAMAMLASCCFPESPGKP